MHTQTCNTYILHLPTVRQNEIEREIRYKVYVDYIVV